MQVNTDYGQKAEVDHEKLMVVSSWSSMAVRSPVRPQATEINPEWSRKLGFHVALLVGDQS